jgi:molybdopterin-guanine dinucleotide biosynthesis protein A
MIPPLYGLVLSGGLSTRMGRDKGAIVYHATDQRSHCCNLLKPFCDDVFISVRKEQESLISPGLNLIFDRLEDVGPSAGILAAHEMNPSAAWLVLACDMPNITSDEISLLVHSRNPALSASCYSLSTIEPFFSIWEPRALSYLKKCGHSSPRRALQSLNCELISGDSFALRNVNAPEYVKQ